MHLTSDMITTQEDLIKVNSGHRLVIHTHLDRCRTFSPECDFDLWMPLNLDCNFYDHITNTTVDLYFDTITYSDGSSKLIIARRRKMVKYNMLFRERFSTTVLYAQPVFIQSRCRYPTDDPTSFLVDTNRRVKVLTLYCKFCLALCDDIPVNTIVICYAYRTAGIFHDMCISHSSH